MQDPVVNFWCFKWGEKYGDEYVIRLFNSLKKHCRVPFKFYCVTEKPVSHPDIFNADINQLRLFGSPIFTAEKIELMNHARLGNHVILDLDILIHNDITDLVTCQLKKPTFIWTHWTPEWHTKNIPAKTACFINSSFVRWEGTTAQNLYEALTLEYPGLSHEYDSCDKYLFYEHHLKHEPFDFWPAEYFYNYNEPSEWQYKINPDAKACLFNTSHLVKLKRRYFELDNTPTEHTEIWEGYDEIIS